MIAFDVKFPQITIPLPKEAVGTVRGTIAFPAEYAKHHDKTLSPNQQRDIYVGSFRRRESAIRRNFAQFYRASNHLEQSVEAVTREHLSDMRRFELDAPGPRPPARNPFLDRVRRVTGQLSDTAFIRVEKVQ